MSEHPDVVAEVERRYAESMRLSAQLYDLRVPAVALILAGLLACATALALMVPWAWVLVVLLLAASATGFVQATRGVRAARARMFAFPNWVGVMTDSEREALALLPPYRLEPAFVAHPDQLDRLLKPTPQDSAQQLREIPGHLVAVGALGLLAFTGIVLSLGIPTFVIIGSETVSSAPWILVPFFAGLPLVLLVLQLNAVSDVARAAYAQQVVHAELELPRLWASHPEFATGRVVRPGADGYTIDHSALPIKPSSATVSRLTRITLPIAFGLVFFVAILDQLTTGLPPAV